MNISSEVKGHFLRLYQMAITDGEFSKTELRMLYDFAEERNISKSELEHILTHTTGKIDIPEKVESRIEYLHDLALMIWADGIVTEDERTTLEKYIRKFGFLEENISALADFFINNVKEGKTKSEVLNLINHE